MIKDVADSVRPVKEELEEDITKHIHRETLSELSMEEVEMIVNEREDWTYADWELTLQNDLQSFKEVTISEWNRQWFLPCCKRFED